MNSESLGGVIHTYQRYDPRNFPPPSQPPPDLVSPAFEHMLEYGDMSELTDEELARAVHLDIRQIAGLGPSLESLKKMLLERKRKILETWETKRVVAAAKKTFQTQAESMQPPKELAPSFQKAVKDEQLRELERLWYRAGSERSKFARQLLQLAERLGEKYQVDDPAALHEHPTCFAARPAVPQQPRYAEPANHSDHRRLTDRALRRFGPVSAVPVRPADGSGNDARSVALSA